MSNPFTMAKAIATDAEFAGKIITGTIDHSGEALWLDGFHVSIASYSLCLNTGFVDANGEEIFEGDYVRSRYGDRDEFVYFDEKLGAFCTSRVETISETEIGGEDSETRYCQYPNATVVRRLTAARANLVNINGSMLDALAEPTVDETPTVEPVEVDADIEDITHVDPDAGDDISVDWAARVDEAPGEY